MNATLENLFIFEKNRFERDSQEYENPILALLYFSLSELLIELR